MAIFIVRRLVVSIFVLVAATFVVYAGTAVSGDPLADLRGQQQAGIEARIAERTQIMQLDTPILLRWLGWLGDLVTGELGVNNRGQSVSGLLAPAVSATLQLVIAATVLAIVLGVIIGIVSALRQYSGFDYSITFAAFLFFSLPVFWVATMLKEFGAIQFNNWLADPSIPLPVVGLVSVLSGLAWMALLGGDRDRKLVILATSSVATAAVLEFLSASGWFAEPGFGFPMIVLSSIGAAFGVTYLVVGFRYRPPLLAALAAAAVGWVAYLVLDPVLADPTWAVIALLALVTVAIGLGIGRLVGGLQARQAMATATLTGLATGGLIFLDYLITAYSSYAERSNGRPISTIGARTPNFAGDFWQTGIDSAGHLVLPTAALLLISFAVYTRYTRASMLEVMNQDYVRTARAKGLTERAVITKHGFRNALIPVTTLMAFDFGGVIGGAVITETVFGWQGMGKLFIDGLSEVDPPPVMGFFLVAGTSIVVFNMLADIAYAYLDPRIRVS